MEIQGQEVLSLQDALHCSTHLSIRWRHCKILRPTCDFLQMHLQEPEFFLVHECVSEVTRLVISRLLCEISTRRSTSKSGTGKVYLSHYLRRPAKSTFKHLCKQTPLWLVVMRKEPQEPWRTRRPWERDVEQSALTHARHTHCASRQLGTTADQRYDVPWDWLQEACQLAWVHWGTRCEGFRSKEGPHYQIDQSARDQLERDPVWGAPEKLSRTCHHTSNNQTLFMSLEIPRGFLSQAVLHWLSWGLCHARKCRFKDLCKRKGMTCDCPTDVCMKNLPQKAEQGKNAGTNSCTRFPQASYFKKMRNVCQKYGGTCMTWYSEYKRYRHGIRNQIPAQPRKVQRN